MIVNFYLPETRASSMDGDLACGRTTTGGNCDINKRSLGCHQPTVMSWHKMLGMAADQLVFLEMCRN
jgi:hypothetical protein